MPRHGQQYGVLYGVRSRSYGTRHTVRTTHAEEGCSHLEDNADLNVNVTAAVSRPARCPHFARRRKQTAAASLGRPNEARCRGQAAAGQPSEWELDQRSGLPRLLGSRPTSPRFRAHGKFVLTQPVKQSAPICPILPGEGRLEPEVRHAATRPRRAQYPSRPGEANTELYRVSRTARSMTRLHLCISASLSNTPATGYGGRRRRNNCSASRLGAQMTERTAWCVAVLKPLRSQPSHHPTHTCTTPATLNAATLQDLVP